MLVRWSCLRGWWCWRRFHWCLTKDCCGRCTFGHSTKWLRGVSWPPQSSCLFVSHGGAGGAGEVDDFETFEANLAAPLLEIRAGVIESIAELDEHAQGHEQAL